jgi:hypothetical protein
MQNIQYAKRGHEKARTEDGVDVGKRAVTQADCLLPQSEVGSVFADKTSRATPATDREPAPDFVHSTSRPDA